MDLETPSGQNASLPYLVHGNDGFLYFSWVEKSDSGMVEFKFSKFVNDGWSTPELIANGNDWFVNWADYPMLAINQKGDKMAHFLAKSAEGTYSYDVNLVAKPFDSKSWSPAFVPHQDGTPTEHGFVTMVPLSNGSFQTAWLDGRNTGEGHDAPGGAMTIRTAEITATGEVIRNNELDNRVCDCCQTTGVHHPNGAMFFYRDRSEIEIRDISIVRNIGNNWTNPKPLYKDQWNIAGCPVNGPRADVIGDQIAVAWYSAANNQPQVKVIFSSDAGASFQNPILIDEMSPIGRVDIAMISENTALVTWLGSVDGQAKIMGRIIQSNGTMEDVFVISETDESRSSGFPQTEIVNGVAYFAWTAMKDEQTVIQMKQMIVSDKASM